MENEKAVKKDEKIQEKNEEIQENEKHGENNIEIVVKLKKKIEENNEKARDAFFLKRTVLKLFYCEESPHMQVLCSEAPFIWGATTLWKSPRVSPQGQSFS